MYLFISKLWWTVVLRGALLLLFGIIAVTAPLMPINTLLSYLGFMSLGIGVIQILASVSLRKSVSNWYILFAIALLDIALGIYIIIKTDSAADIFRYIIIIWAFIMATSQFILALKPSQLRIFLLINGTLSLAFALVIFFNLFPSNINFMLGFYTILFSLFLVYAGFKMKNLGTLKSVVESKDSLPKK